MQDRENYCRLLGLNPLRESTYSFDAIDKKLVAKEAKWKKDSGDKQNDVEKRFQFGLYLEMAPEIRRVMKDPVLRSKEFDEGRKLLKSKASKLNKDSIILHDGSRVLLPGTADSLVKKLQWDGVTKDDLISLAGIRNTSVPKIVNDKIIAAYKGLRAVHTFTPVDMLNQLIGISALEIDTPPLSDGCSYSQIRMAFDACEKRVGSVRQDILRNQDSYIQTLRSLKMVLSPDQELANLIKYGRCMKALTPAMQMMDEDYGQPFNREYIDNIMNIYLRNINVDRNMAMSILEDYCVKKKYLANFSNKDSKLTICPNCNSLVETGAHVMCCSVCGFSIKTSCPQCGTQQTAGNNVCVKCGFDFQKGLVKAKDLERRFKVDLRMGNVDKAAEDLKEIKKAYSTYPGLDLLNQELRTITVRRDAGLKKIEQAHKLDRFCDVKEYIENIQLDFPTITESNVDLKRKYSEAQMRIQEADSLCVRAEKALNKDEMMSFYVMAAEKCPDHPIARSKMEEYPPEGPADASAKAMDGKILIKYAVPEDRTGMTFCIYRGRGTLPVVNHDTVPLAEIPGGVFLDKTMDPGVDFYYSVYSKRWGILSRDATSCGPAMVFVEVENVKLEPIQDGIRITYEKPKGCKRVRIWRKEGTTAAGTGDEIELVHSGEPVIEDHGLKGGVKYHYLFVAEYENKGKIERSMGADYSCITIKYPEPPKIEIMWNKSDGSYTAKWKTKENVVLYSSSKRVNMLGRMVKMSDVTSWMKEIRPIDTYKDGMKFTLPDGVTQYIYPMIAAGKMAVRGKEVMVANLKPFRDVSYTISGNDCDLCMNWPTDAESAIIAIKDNTAASGPEDIGAEKITITREAYKSDKLVRIPLGNSKKRVVTLFAIYEVEGNRMASRGISIDIYSGICTKVRYGLTASKISKDETQVTVAIDTDPSIRAMPPAIAVHVKEGLPLKKWDGEAVWNSGRAIPLSAGRASFSFIVRGDSDLRKVRLFFVNDEDYNLFRFIHPIFRES